MTSSPCLRRCASGWRRSQCLLLRPLLRLLPLLHPLRRLLLLLHPLLWLLLLNPLLRLQLRRDASSRCLLHLCLWRSLRRLWHLQRALLRRPCG